MADILPFCGVRYAVKESRALSELAAPPYDVISEQEQAALYDRHPHNVVRLILGREPDQYAQARSLFQEWRRTGVLVADDCPSLYVYRQSFDDPATGAPLPERLGLVCLLKLEDYASGKVLPHENTLTAAKADRLELLRATNAQLESIYGLYSDPDGAVQSFLKEYDDREPVIEHVDSMIGSTHSIERIKDANAIATLRALLQDKPIFIADGHHRYETSLNYRREARAAQPNITDDTPIAADYILITLTAFEDEGLLVLPTHRLVRHVDQALVDALPEKLSARFALSSLPAASLPDAIAAQAAEGRKAFGLVLPGGRSFLATLTVPVSQIPALMSGADSDAAKILDVSVLHRLVFEPYLDISAESLAAGGQVTYTRDADEAIHSVESGESQAAFLLGRPSVKDVRDVSLAGDKMPQKSTFFFPKLLSGLLMRDLRLDHPAEVLAFESD